MDRCWTTFLCNVRGIDLLGSWLTWRTVAICMVLCGDLLCRRRRMPAIWSRPAGTMPRMGTRLTKDKLKCLQWLEKPVTIDSVMAVRYGVRRPLVVLIVYFGTRRLPCVSIYHTDDGGNTLEILPAEHLITSTQLHALHHNIVSHCCLKQLPIFLNLFSNKHQSRSHNILLYYKKTNFQWRVCKKYLTAEFVTDKDWHNKHESYSVSPTSRAQFEW